jgi:endonuclease YncB( thermonuclease family)
MGGWALIIAAGLTAGWVLDARAQRIDFPCGSEDMPAGRVMRVLDGRSFVLDDGREIRLAALEVPTESGRDGASPRSALEALLIGHTVALRQGEATPDRYNRIIAHAYRIDVDLPGAGGNQFVTSDLLANGHARVAANTGSMACATELLSHERAARTAKIGLWNDPQYAILGGGDLAGLVAKQGRFAVVEGQVVSVRESGGTIYVNFGRRWSQALTVTISKRQERIFVDAGMAPKQLDNRRVRVRGWIELRNGPRIEASRPEQIETVGLN